MQLSNKSNINAALAAATCALLNTTMASPAQAQDLKDPSDWQFDTAILYYGETDRVQLAEGVISATKDFGDQHIFNTKIVIDTLTGASASGAVSQATAQTFTRPSGKGQYTIDANDIALDDTFQDTRAQVSANWTQPISNDTRMSVGGNLSKEYDYLSLGTSLSFERDYFNKNTTALIGLSAQYDMIDPVGGAPIGLSSMVINPDYVNDDHDDDDDDDDEHENDSDTSSAFKTAFNATRADDSEDKSTIDLLLGVTQIINKRMLMQFNYSFSNSSGYLSDPYKLVSQVNDNGETQAILHENRPDKRTKHSVYWQTKYAFDKAIADVSYRFASDDWDVQSHTIDSRFRIQLSDSSYIQPHLRYYSQGAAEFYRPFLQTGDALPSYASADYRLGEMTAYTVGLKYGQKLQNGHEWGMRLEYYQQDPKNAGYVAPGVLQDQELYPSIKAIIAQVNYKF